MIKISIITPVYKVPLDFLRICFDSLAAQTMQESEFIIVSDGASEEECALCEEYRIKDSRFKFFKRKHAGVSATRNYGIKQAQGEYITFVDSDDWINPDSCTNSYKYAKETVGLAVFIPYPYAGDIVRDKQNLLCLLKGANPHFYLTCVGATKENHPVATTAEEWLTYLRRWAKGLK